MQGANMSRDTNRVQRKVRIPSSKRKKSGAKKEKKPGEIPCGISSCDGHADKHLGGRSLRGFDNYGAGPRNSRTSYVGGNNVVLVNLDYSYEITKQSNFPFYLNVFNDYGLLWQNKTNPSHSDENIRSSVGFSIKYYSPIGPIGFTWGFPIMDEEYDIKRMFLFSVGNLD